VKYSVIIICIIIMVILFVYLYRCHGHSGGYQIILISMLCIMPWSSAIYRYYRYILVIHKSSNCLFITYSMLCFSQVDSNCVMFFCNC